LTFLPNINEFSNLFLHSAKNKVSRDSKEEKYVVHSKPPSHSRRIYGH
jgi:hypothetical protein